MNRRSMSQGSTESTLYHTKESNGKDGKAEQVLNEGLRSLGEIEDLNLPEIVRNTIMNYVDVNLSSYCTNTLTFTWKEEKCSYSSLVRKCHAFGFLISDEHIRNLIYGTIVNANTGTTSFIHGENVWKPWLDALVKSGRVTISKVATLAVRAGRLSITKWCLYQNPDCLQNISIAGANRLLQLNTIEMMGGTASVFEHWKFIREKGIVSNQQILSFLTLDPPEAVSERMVDDTAGLSDLYEEDEEEDDGDGDEEEYPSPQSLSAWKTSLEKNAVFQPGWNFDHDDQKFASLIEKLQMSESKSPNRHLHTQTIRHRSLSSFLLGFLTQHQSLDRKPFYQWFQWMRSIGIDTRGLLFEPWQLISLLVWSLKDNHCVEWLAWLEPYIKDIDSAILRDVDKILVGHGFRYRHQKSLPIWRRLCLRYHPTIFFEYVNLCQFDIDWKSEEWAILRDNYMKLTELSSKRYRPPSDLTDCWPHSLVELFALAVKSRLIPTSDIQPREWVRIALEDRRNSPLKYLLLRVQSKNRPQSENQTLFSFQDIVEPMIAPKSLIDMITGPHQLPMQTIDEIVAFFTERHDHKLDFFTKLSEHGDTRWKESKSWKLSVETLARAIRASEKNYHGFDSPYFVSYTTLVINERIWNADEALHLVPRLLQLLSGRRKGVEIVVKMAMVVHWAYPLLTAKCPEWAIPKKESGWDSEMWQHYVRMSGLRVI